MLYIQVLSERVKSSSNTRRDSKQNAGFRTGHDKMSFPKTDVSQNRNFLKTSFPKIGAKVSQEFPDTSPNADSTTQKDGTMRRLRTGGLLPLHQMLLRVSRESDLRRRLAYFLRKTGSRNFLERMTPKIARCNPTSYPKIARF